MSRFYLLFLLFMGAWRVQAQDFINYSHPKKISFQARALKFGMRCIGLKYNIERHIRKQKYKDRPRRPSRSIARRYALQVDSLEHRAIWTIQPKSVAPQAPVILYLHGGGYIHNILSFHWSFLKRLEAATGAIIVVPDYPLAPQANPKAVYDFALRVYADILAKYPNRKVIFMGDSAGGGLSLGLAQTLRDEGRKGPDQIILLSPWLDVTSSQPEALAVAPKDRMLDIKGLREAGKIYAQDYALQSPQVSPIFGQMQGLGQISIFIGTHDVFVADCRALQRRLTAEGIGHHYFEYPKMFHVWVAVVSLPEAKSAIAQIAELVRAQP